MDFEYRMRTAMAGVEQDSVWPVAVHTRGRADRATDCNNVHGARGLNLARLN